MEKQKLKMETVGGFLLYATCLFFILLFITSAF